MPAANCPTGLHAGSMHQLNLGLFKFRKVFLSSTFWLFNWAQAQISSNNELITALNSLGLTAWQDNCLRHVSNPRFYRFASAFGVKRMIGMCLVFHQFYAFT